MEHAMKTCTKCGRQLPHESFYPRATNPDGLRQPCKECTARHMKEYRNRPENLERKRRHSRDYYRRPDVRERVLAASKRRRRSDYLRHKFGITQSDISEMAARQGWRCAICLRPFRETPNVDHDHATGQIRGLLCNSCNLGLGKFKDDPCSLDRAVEYLVEHSRRP